MKILCQVVAVYPFTLIVSLPNQLFGNIPITNISSQLTSALESADADDVPDDRSGAEDEEEEENTDQDKTPPDLLELFQVGQYLRATVAAVKPPGTTEGQVFNYSRDEVERASRRVELSLIPEQVNSGLLKSDLKKGFVSDVSCVWT